MGVGVFSPAAVVTVMGGDDGVVLDHDDEESTEEHRLRFTLRSTMASDPDDKDLKLRSMGSACCDSGSGTSESDGEHFFSC